MRRSACYGSTYAKSVLPRGISSYSSFYGGNSERIKGLFDVDMIFIKEGICSLENIEFKKKKKNIIWTVKFCAFQRVYNLIADFPYRNLPKDSYFWYNTA